MSSEHAEQRSKIGLFLPGVIVTQLNRSTPSFFSRLANISAREAASEDMSYLEAAGLYHAVTLATDFPPFCDQGEED